MPPLASSPRRVAAHVLSVALGALTLSCASSHLVGDLGPIPRGPDASEILLRARYPDAGAVILLDDGTMEIFGGGELGMSVFEHHRVTRILNSRGHKYAYVVIPYGEMSSVEDIQARTVSPSGVVTPLDSKNIFDVGLYPSFVFFSDQRAKIFTLPAVQDSSVVEYRYRLAIHNRTLWHGWYFQTESPVLLSRFTLVCPSEWKLTSRLYGIPIEPSKVVAPAGFKATQIWEAHDVAPLASEFAMPPRSEHIARLAMAPIGISTWNDVAGWYHSLAEPRMRGGSELRARALEITAGALTDAEKLRRIFGWVRDHVRYVAVEIGIGGFQPHPADEVMVNQYGDCKDMATILCAMGRAVGLQIQPVLISTWQNGSPDTTLATPFHFNHAIAYCPAAGESGVWLDATEKGCPFGELPWYDQGLPVLVVGERGEGAIRMTPRRGAAQNTMLLRWNAHLRADGSARVRGETVVWGSAATQLRDELLSVDREGRRQWLEASLASRCNGIELDSMAFHGVEPVADTLRIGYGFHTATFAARRGERMTFRPGSITMSDLSDYFRSPARSLPVRFRFPLRTELDLTLQLPGFWEFEGPPVRDTLVSEFGRWNRSWTADGVTVRFCSMFEHAGDDIAPREYPRFREFLDAQRRADLQDASFVRP